MSGSADISVGTAVREDLEKARAAVLEGRGPGASSEEVAAHGRNKTIQGGVPVQLRLIHTAQEAARARGDDATLANALTAQAAAGFAVPQEAEEASGIGAAAGRPPQDDQDNRGVGIPGAAKVIAAVATLLVIRLLARRRRSEKRVSGGVSVRRTESVDRPR